MSGLLAPDFLSGNLRIARGRWRRRRVAELKKDGGGIGGGRSRTIFLTGTETGPFLRLSRLLLSDNVEIKSGVPIIVNAKESDPPSSATNSLHSFIHSFYIYSMIAQRYIAHNPQPSKFLLHFPCKIVIMNRASVVSPAPAWQILIVSLLLSSSIFLASCNVALVAPLTRDSATLQYVMEIEYKTPLQKEKLVIDLSGDFMWVQCNPGAVYQSSTYLPIPCHTPLCTASGSSLFGCGHCRYVPLSTRCENNTCVEVLMNAVTGTEVFDAKLSQDVVALSTIEDAKVKVPQFAFVCAPPSLLRGLARGVAGMAGMNWAPLALPFQLTVSLELDRKFGLCLPSGDQARGAVFFGSPSFGPDKANVKLNYTFLQVPSRPREYFLGVNGIAINQKKLAIESDTLKVNVVGSGGTAISSVVPYTRVATPIYTAIVNAFVKESAAMNISRVASVKPFDACFDAKSVRSTKVGPAVPVIDLLLDNEFVYWRIYGGNSMVEAKDGVLCLAFVDAGAYPGTTIVIGTQQLQDNLLLFDLIEFKLFFSSSLLAFDTKCANFI